MSEQLTVEDAIYAMEEALKELKKLDPAQTLSGSFDMGGYGGDSHEINEAFYFDISGGQAGNDPDYLAECLFDELDGEGKFEADPELGEKLDSFETSQEQCEYIKEHFPDLYQYEVARQSGVCITAVWY